MNKTILCSGGVGPERVEFLNSYLDKLINDGMDKEIIIYDATYYFVKYAKYDYIHYYCVDSVVGYLNKLKEIKNIQKKVYVISDVYAGLFYSKENKELIKDLILNKDNIEILLLARHIDFVPKEILDLINTKVTYQEINTVLANTK